VKTTTPQGVWHEGPSPQEAGSQESHSRGGGLFVCPSRMPQERRSTASWAWTLPAHPHGQDARATETTHGFPVEVDQLVAASTPVDQPDVHRPPIRGSDVHDLSPPARPHRDPQLAACSGYHRARRVGVVADADAGLAVPRSLAADGVGGRAWSGWLCWSGCCWRLRPWCSRGLRCGWRLGRTS